MYKKSNIESPKNGVSIEKSLVNDQINEPVKLSCSCGGKIFERLVQVRGAWRYVMTEQMVVIESSPDELRFSQEPKYVRCDNCKERVPNPMYLDPSMLRLCNGSLERIEAMRENQKTGT